MAIINHSSIRIGTCDIITYTVLCNFMQVFYLEGAMIGKDGLISNYRTIYTFLPFTVSLPWQKSLTDSISI
jgi:hypothetical protein